MSKKIDSALRDLVKALGKHADVASDPKSSRHKLQKSNAKVRSAATAYGSIVSARRNIDSPFSEIPDPRLDEPTVESLKAERDAIASKRERSVGKDGAGEKGAHAATGQAAASGQTETVAL